MENANEEFGIVGMRTGSMVLEDGVIAGMTDLRGIEMGREIIIGIVVRWKETGSAIE